MLKPENADDLLVDLDESQRKAVTSAAQPLAILAPAGSGKTRVLTRRIAWRVATEDAEAPHVMALTFTRKAAGEMRSRLARLGLARGVAAGTFHSIAYAQLRALWIEQGRPPPTLAARKGPLLGEVLASLNGTGGKLTASALAGEIEWAKARLLGPNDYAAGVAEAHRRPPAAPDQVAAAYAGYERLKNRNKLVDLDDLLKLCGDALLSNPAFAAAQRWRFRHLFVDEFQDVNPLQLRLLDAWRGDRYDLCVVGDPQQAIYAWNGADPSLLGKFRTLYPPADVISLEHNYRSTPQVLRAANEVLHKAKLTPTAAVPTQADGPAPTVVGYPTDRDEAIAIARNLRDRRGPRTAWADQAVLVRTHGQIAMVTEALRASRIPHRVRGAAALLEDAAVRRGLDLLRGDRRPLSASLADLDALQTELEEQHAQPDAEDRNADDSRTQSSGASALSILIELARDHQRIDPTTTAAGFTAWAVATLQTEGADKTGDAVTVATFHAAKGLEWPVVHLAGLEDGFVPIGHARTTTARAEEARLLYVAMTRAVEQLSCTWANRRTFKGRTVDRRICPWLKGLAGTESATDPRLPKPPATGWQQLLAGPRASLEAARPEPSPALRSARIWRDDAARRARVDPATIIDDRLLEAVVDAMPADPDELAAVPGMGPILVTRIGNGLLTALHEPG